MKYMSDHYSRYATKCRQLVSWLNSASPKQHIGWTYTKTVLVQHDTSHFFRKHYLFLRHSTYWYKHAWWHPVCYSHWEKYTWCLLVHCSYRQRCAWWLPVRYTYRQKHAWWIPACYTYRHQHAWRLPVCSTAAKEAHNKHEQSHCEEDV